MNVFETQIKQIGNGFIKTYWKYHKAGVGYGFAPSHITPTSLPFKRVNGRHKRLGASKGCHAKQFDISSHKVFKTFKSRNSIPLRFNMCNGVFRFGRKDCMHLKTKFLY